LVIFLAATLPPILPPLLPMRRRNSITSVGVVSRWLIDPHYSLALYCFCCHQA
jgi:hypothetical protein